MTPRPTNVRTVSRVSVPVGYYATEYVKSGTLQPGRPTVEQKRVYYASVGALDKQPLSHKRRATGRMLTDAQWKQILQLRKTMTCAEIGRIYDRDPKTIWDGCASRGAKPVYGGRKVTAA